MTSEPPPLLQGTGGEKVACSECKIRLSFCRGVLLVSEEQGFINSRDDDRRWMAGVHLGTGKEPRKRNGLPLPLHRHANTKRGRQSEEPPGYGYGCNTTTTSTTTATTTTAITTTTTTTTALMTTFLL